MATTVHVNLFQVSTRAADNRQIAGVPPSAVIDAATATATASSAEIPGIVGQRGQVWSITVTGGNVWIKSGVTGSTTAASGDGWLMLDGQTRELGVSAADEVLAIKTA